MWDVDLTGRSPAGMDLDVRWVHGTPTGRHGDEPTLQVHAADEHTYLLRQSKNVTAEAPFCYLLIGNTTALLLDTGAVGPVELNPIRAVVDDLLSRWLQRHPREGHRLIVAHTHAHGDHVAGDHQFADRPDTTIVGRDVAAVRRFFALVDWPEGISELDLGGRRLEVIPVPGHHPTHIAVYDHWSGFLLTGDVLYPGRLYAPDYPAFLRSADRLARFATERDVTWVMGAHVEMTLTPGRDYPLGSRYQPNEAPLPMDAGAVERLRERSLQLAGRLGRHVFDDMIIWNSPGRVGMARERLRGYVRRLAERSTRPR